MKHYLNKWKICKSDRNFILSILIGSLFLIISLIVNYFAGTYATLRASLPVSDIILSNIPVFNVDFFFNFGPIIFWVFVIIISSNFPNKIPFILKSIALFVIIRSIFVSLTHIGPFPTQGTMISGDILNKLNFTGDLFFSGHTGLPFLMSLVFWDNKILRYIFLTSSFIFGAVVLLGHYHYSIDVLGAFFITYTIFHLAKFLFKKDFKTLKNSLHQK